MLKYLSVCSGIEAASVAWHPLGWQPVAFSEIEAFPSAVLSHHYPNVPNLGDMTRYKEWDLETVELVIGGTPCQSFSVAGLRKGMDDPRGNLALTYCGILNCYRPQWFIWENVPGILSSGDGRDFGSFLGAVAKLGYGFAYRVLDAQYWGVAQRRQRVFVVGHLGDWRPAAAVLFETESLSRDIAPSREKGQEATRDTIKCFETHSPDEQREPCVAIQGNLIGREAGGPDGVGASDDGMMYTLTKTDIHAVAYNITFCDANGTRSDRPDGGLYINETEVSASLTRAGIGTNVVQPIVLDDQGGSVMRVTQNGIAGTLRHETHGHEPCIVTHVGALCARDYKGVGNQYVQEGKCIPTSSAVRRLTPIECERLQGFPDNYTQIPYKGKDPDVCPDGLRYKALGNSMAVPVVAWIGKRIEQFITFTK